jgi:hypothetical protein
MDRLGALCRGRGRSFRKSLGMFNFKVKEQGIKPIRKPGAIPLQTKVKLLRVDYCLT